MEDLPEALELRVRMGRGIGAAVLTMLWLSAWTAGCVFLVYNLLNDFSVSSLLFTIPFLAAWLFVFAVLCGMLFGKERLRLDRDGLLHERTVIFARRRFVPLGEVRRILEWDPSRRAGQPQPPIAITTAGSPVTFGNALAGDERAWLCSLLRRRLLQLTKGQETLRRVETPSRDKDEALSQLEQPGLASKLLQAWPSAPESSGSGLRVVEDFDQVTVRSRGRLSPGGIALGAFAACFWNGGVVVFIASLLKDFNWFIFFFLIPFELVGLILLVAFLAVLFAPTIGLSWTFHQGELTESRHFLGFRRSRLIDPFSIRRVVAGMGKPPARRTSMFQIASTSELYRIALVDRDEAEAAAFDGLTEMEAVTILHLLKSHHPGWLENPIRPEAC